MNILFLILLALGRAHAHAPFVDEFGYDLHACGWTPELEREAAELLAKRYVHAFPGNAWDLLATSGPRRAHLNPLEVREIEWLVRTLGPDLTALRCEELREELSGVARRTRALRDDASAEAPLRRLVAVNVQIFARLIDHAAAARLAGDAVATRRWILKALGVMTRTHLTIAANDGRPQSSRFWPASFDRRRVARELHETFWREATEAITAPPWLARPDPRWRGTDRAAAAVMGFAYLLGAGADPAECWQLLAPGEND